MSTAFKGHDDDLETRSAWPVLRHAVDTSVAEYQTMLNAVPIALKELVQHRKRQTLLIFLHPSVYAARQSYTHSKQLQLEAEEGLPVDHCM